MPAKLPEEEDEGERACKRQRSSSASVVADESPRQRAAFELLRDAASEHADDAHTSRQCVERVLCALTPTETQTVLGALAERAPAALRRLLLALLTPIAAELLTARLERADEQRGGSAATDGDGGFYGRLYGACDAPDAVMARLLDLKEQLAADALQRVLHSVLCPPVVTEAAP